MGKAESQRLSVPQTDRRPVQEFGLVTGLGTVSYWSGVRLPRSIGQIPPRRFPKSGFVDLGGRGGGALFLNLYNDIFIVNVSISDRSFLSLSLNSGFSSSPSSSVNLPLARLTSMSANLLPIGLKVT